MKRKSLLLIQMIFIITFVLNICVSAQNAIIISSEFRGVTKGLVSDIEKAIKKSGYNTQKIDIDSFVSKSAQLNKKYDMLVLPSASALPGYSLNAVESFIAKGGKIIALSTPAWENTSSKVNGKWMDKYSRKTGFNDFKNTTPIIDFTKTNLTDKGWHEGVAPDADNYNYEIITDDERPALHFTATVPGGWNTISKNDVKPLFSNKNNLVMFWAKGSDHTPRLTVELAETDGSRWIATVSLEKQWKSYILAPFEFIKWDPEYKNQKEAVDMNNVFQITVGIATSHTGVAIGNQEYWIGNIYTAKVPDSELDIYSNSFSTNKVFGLDGFSKSGHFFKMENTASLKIRQDQIMTKQYPKFKASKSNIFSNYARPRGMGYGRNKPFRWIPIIDGINAKGEWTGAAATLSINRDGKYKNSAILSFGISDMNFYKNKDVLNIISDCAKRMKNGAFLIEGGSDAFTVLTDKTVRLGAVAGNISNQNKNLNVKISVIDPKGKIVFQKDFKKSLAAKNYYTSETVWQPQTWFQKPYIVKTELYDNGKLVDLLKHELYGYDPNKPKSFVTRKNNMFVKDDKKIKFYGVNFWSSASSGWESFYDMDDPLMHYDPEIIARDLKAVKGMNMNCVLTRFKNWYSYGVGQIDFLRRCEEMGIYAIINLDSNVGKGLPKDFDANVMGEVIKHYSLDKFDIIAGYDICWEPQWGLREDLSYWDKGWNDWVTERYGNVKNAQADWGYPCPTYEDKTTLTHPTNVMMTTDGEWRILVAAYRKYLDSINYSIYNNAINQLRDTDNNHLYSFRMSMTADPTYLYPNNVIPFDYPYLGQAVDFLAPEGYGRFGLDWEKVEPGVFQGYYGKYASPNRPRIWAEMGFPIGGNTPKLYGHSASDLDNQKRCYEQFYKMTSISNMDGIFCWWLPGGFRYGENSDYGIINPDCSDRPVTKFIRDYAQTFFDGLEPKTQGSRFAVDRDSDARGVKGIYEKVSTKFNKEISEGKNPSLINEGSFTTIANTPMLAVGNTPMAENKPYKYIDALVDQIFVKYTNGTYKRLLPGGKINITKGQKISVKIIYINMGESAWLANSNKTVELNVNGKPRPIENNVYKFDKATFYLSLDANSNNIIELKVKDGYRFGEKINLILNDTDITRK